ncbi:AC4 protein [Crassocephalum yellow vein virus - Yuanjiang]|nr:AC4 protein [Crassocephalum yellow vein virus - Yuanjiang]
MGLLISTCLCSSKGNTSARITDSSTWYPQPGQRISIRTFRGLKAPQTSSPTSTRTETPWTGEIPGSTDDLQEEVSNQLVMLTPRHLTQAVSRRLLM